MIAMLMEQIRRPARFLDLATRARSGKYIVLHHLGRSAAGRDAAKTHTGAMSGDYKVMAAQVTARGVCLVDSLELLIDVPELLIRLKSTGSAGGTVVVGESGAFKGMAAPISARRSDSRCHGCPTLRMRRSRRSCRLFRRRAIRST